MTQVARTFTKKLMIAVLALSTVGGTMAATTGEAFAGHRTGTWRYAAPYGYGYGYGYRAPGWGYRNNNGGAVAAGVALGLLAGAAAASAYAPSCYYQAQPVYDAWGNVVYRNVRVCE